MWDDRLVIINLLTRRIEESTERLLHRPRFLVEYRTEYVLYSVLRSLERVRRSRRRRFMCI
jgi:hypothetical protein